MAGNSQVPEVRPARAGRARHPHRCPPDQFCHKRLVCEAFRTRLPWDRELLPASILLPSRQPCFRQKISVSYTRCYCVAHSYRHFRDWNQYAGFVLKTTAPDLKNINLKKFRGKKAGITQYLIHLCIFSMSYHSSMWYMFYTFVMNYV